MGKCCKKTPNIVKFTVHMMPQKLLGRLPFHHTIVPFKWKTFLVLTNCLGNITQGSQKSSFRLTFRWVQKRTVSTPLCPVNLNPMWGMTVIPYLYYQYNMCICFSFLPVTNGMKYNLFVSLKKFICFTDSLWWNIMKYYGLIRFYRG